MDLQRLLNPEQIEAVTFGEGPQLVLAGAGSGKTRVITHRIAWLIGERSVEPYRIAAVTFTNKAAGEMRDRVDRLLGLAPGARSEVFVGTFHRFALRLLRRYGDRVGVSSGFSILDTQDQLALMKRAIEIEDLDPSTTTPRAVLSAVSDAKNRLIGPGKFASEASGFFETRAARAYHRYQALLRQANAVDFDDMISLAVLLLDQESSLRERMQRRLRYLLVDEFQDTNFAQLRLVELVAGPGGSLTAVGDEDQSIYRWRGAELENILQFEEVFPGAVVHKLERNYRSTQTILDASGALVAHNAKRRGKRLWTDSGPGEKIALHYAGDEGDEARWIASRLRALHEQHTWTEMAILLRTNAQTRALEDELLRQRIPYCLIAGVRFYERAEIKDLVAYLRVVRNPRDNLSLRRILNQPPRGIGKATAHSLFEEAEELGNSLWDTLRFGRLRGVSQRGRKALLRFRTLIEELRSLATSQDLPTLLQELIESTGYAKLHRKNEPESQARLENIREFLSAAQEFNEDAGATEQPALLNLGEPGSEPAAIDEDDPLGPELVSDALSMFLDYVSLVSDVDGLESDAGVSVMTLHSAKGLEFPVVFIAGLEEGLLPHFNSQAPEEIEEERRLLYVGMTRAEQRLHLTTCSRRRIAGRYQDQDPSTFLDEIPAGKLEISESNARMPRYDSRLEGVRSFFGNEREAPAYPPRPTPSGIGPARAESTRRTSPLAPTPNPGVAVHPQMAVKHPTLGKGIVLDIDGVGDSAKITVFFERSGKRRLLAKYAGLEPA
jgi:DNA helicase-2/ATP-dependent DNA helicase PcrA